MSTGAQQALDRRSERNAVTGRRQVLRRAVAGGAALAGAALAAGRPPGAGAASGDPAGLVGTWLVTATVAGQAPRLALNTFAADGTLVSTETIPTAAAPPPPPGAPAPAPTVSTAGHGAWVQTGDNRFAFTSLNLLADESAGTFAGTTQVDAQASVDAGGATFRAQFGVKITAPNGAVVFSGQGTAQATRVGVAAGIAPVPSPPATGSGGNLPGLPNTGAGGGPRLAAPLAFVALLGVGLLALGHGALRRRAR